MSEAMFSRSVVEQFAREGFARGWNEALDAAREAVAAVSHWTDSDLNLPLTDGVDEHWVSKARALAAIDALRVQPAERREDNLRGES